MASRRLLCARFRPVAAVPPHGSEPVPLADGERREDDVVAALLRLSPLVECGDGEALCDLTGRHAAFQDEAGWARAVGRALSEALGGEAPALGVAGSRLVARIAAQVGRPGRVRRVPPGGEAAFLAPLPLGVLPLDPDTASRLVRLGIRRVGELAVLSPGDLQRQLGPRGAGVSRWSRGEDATGVTPRAPERRRAERVVLDGAVSEVGALRFTAQRCAQSTGERLRREGLAAGWAALALEAEGSGEVIARVVPPSPAGGPAELWPVVLRLLGALEPPAPVTAVRLEVGELRPAGGRQLDMWRQADASRERIAQAAARLEARFGTGAVRRARLAVDPGELAERRFTWEEPATGAPAVAASTTTSRR